MSFPASPGAAFHVPKPNEDDYQIFATELRPDAEAKLVSTGKGQCTCAYYHPDGKSILVPIDGDLYLGKLDGEPSITFQRTFPHPVKEVWAAITDPERLARMGQQAGQWAREAFAPDRYAALVVSRLL